MTALTGTGRLIRLILRRDRLVLPVWVLLFGMLPATYASATKELYPTEQGREQIYASIVANPSLSSTLGPVFGPSLGALTAWRAGIMVLFIGLVSALTVIRHTRTEEEAGRRELLSATVLGRQAPLAAALVVVVAANVVMGAIMVAMLTSAGLPTTGSVALGVSYAAAGLLFAAVGAVAAQLTEGAGAARGIAIGVLGAVFLIRAAGDAAGPGGNLAWLSWLSPIGWVHRVRPFAGEQWWVLGPIVALGLALLAGAVGLLQRRDLGAGVLPARLGPAHASALLRSPVALAWRLHRRSMLGWTVGFAVIGAVIGGAAQSIESMAEGSSQLREMLARIGGASVLTDAYIAATLSLLALAVAGYAIATTLRLRTEETVLRAELVLATAVSRPSWTLSHLLFTLLGPVLALAALGTTIAAASGSAGGDLAGHWSDVVGGAMLYLPAIWVLAGIAMAGFGLLPRLAAAIAWAALAICLFLAFLGPLLQLDQQILNLSPFTHIPKLPGGQLTTAPILWLLATAAALTVTGIAAFRRRDLDSTA